MIEQEIAARVIAMLDGSWIEINADKDVRINNKPRFHRKELGDAERWRNYMGDADEILNEFPARSLRRNGPVGTGVSSRQSHSQGTDGAT